MAEAFISDAKEFWGWPLGSTGGHWSPAYDISTHEMWNISSLFHFISSPGVPCCAVRMFCFITLLSFIFVGSLSVSHWFCICSLIPKNASVRQQGVLSLLQFRHHDVMKWHKKARPVSILITFFAIWLFCIHGLFCQFSRDIYHSYDLGLVTSEGTELQCKPRRTVCIFFCYRCVKNDCCEIGS